MWTKINEENSDTFEEQDSNLLLLYDYNIVLRDYWEQNRAFPNLRSLE